MSTVSRLMSVVIAFCIFTVESMASASADQPYSFQSIELAEAEFVPYPAQSSSGEIRAQGSSWTPLNVSLDGGGSYSSINVPESEFGGRTDQIDWKQISVSPDGQYVVAASARGNAGGYVYIADTTLPDGISISRFDNLGNANWTGVVFGASTRDLLVVDGVSTIWGMPANGTNCDTETCIGSGNDGSNLNNGWDPVGEHPFAAAFVSIDRGQTWSERIQLPAFDRGVELTATFQNSKFILRGTTTDVDGNPITSYFELRDSRRGVTESPSSDIRTKDPREKERRQIRTAQENIVAKLMAKAVPSFAEIQRANIGNLTALTAEHFVNELMENSFAEEINFQKIHETALKWSSIESLMTQERPTINSLVQSGLVAKELVGKASILRVIGLLPLESRDSIVEIKSAVENILKEKSARKERLIKRMSKI